jgi:hypothetical protein
VEPVNSAAEKGPSPLPLVLAHGSARNVGRDAADHKGVHGSGAGHAGDAADVFDEVVPAMPAMATQTDRREPVMNAWRIAELWTELMSVLGYERFGAQGPEIGAASARFPGCATRSGRSASI